MSDTRKVNVWFTTMASTCVTLDVPVDTDDDEIEEMAYDYLPSRLCAQCAGFGSQPGIDLGDWELDNSNGSAVEPCNVEV